MRRTFNSIFVGAGVQPPLPMVETMSLKSIETVLRNAESRTQFPSCCAAVAGTDSQAHGANLLRCRWPHCARE
jgi:hypothetical protein